MLDVRERLQQGPATTFEWDKEARASRELMSSAQKPLYSSKIIKAGALLTDTKTLLVHWDVEAFIRNNIDRMRRENIFGKASRSRVEDVLAIFRQRYLIENAVTKELVALVRY
jgi:hypothetical protein